MTVYFWKKFKKDLQRLNDEGLKEQVAKLIEEIERAPDLRHLHNLKKMKGHPMAYRFRLGNYCLGVFIEETLSP